MHTRFRVIFGSLLIIGFIALIPATNLGLVSQTKWALKAFSRILTAYISGRVMARRGSGRISGRVPGISGARSLIELLGAQTDSLHTASRTFDSAQTLASMPREVSAPTEPFGRFISSDWVPSALSPANQKGLASVVPYVVSASIMALAADGDAISHVMPAGVLEGRRSRTSLSGGAMLGMIESSPLLYGEDAALSSQAGEKKEDKPNPPLSPAPVPD
jgi:hypothetical protein